MNITELKPEKIRRQQDYDREIQSLRDYVNGMSSIPNYGFLSKISEKLRDISINYNLHWTDAVTQHLPEIGDPLYLLLELGSERKLKYKLTIEQIEEIPPEVPIKKRKWYQLF